MYAPSMPASLCSEGPQVLYRPLAYIPSGAMARFRFVDARYPALVMDGAMSDPDERLVRVGWPTRLRAEAQ